MHRIAHAFAASHAARRPAVMPFICGGHPHALATASLLPALSDAGATVIEVGIPFSDPIADGPVIAAAMHDAIAAGATPQGTLDQIHAARDATSAAIVAMVSYSIVRRAGEHHFCRACADAGVDGLIVPDLPLEESESLRAHARDAGLALSLLVSPTTPPERADAIARASTGFVYLLARAGITGESAALDAAALAPRTAALRRSTSLPIACGFGISTPAQVREVLHHADAAIVGSALVRRLSDAAAHNQDPAAAGAQFVRSLIAGAHAS